MAKVGQKSERLSILRTSRNRLSWIGGGVSANLHRACGAPGWIILAASPMPLSLMDLVAHRPARRHSSRRRALDCLRDDRDGIVAEHGVVRRNRDVSHVSPARPLREF